MHQISLEQFEGPLDLLLQLIEKNKLHITEISLAKVTDQYLEYIENDENIASTEVADFLLIASKLIYLKSKHLLPEAFVEEEEAGDLESQLKIYRQYYQASKIVEKMFANQKKYSHIRMQAFRMPRPEGFVAPENVNQENMKESFLDILRRVQRIVNLPKAVIARAISIGEKIQAIQSMIQSGQRFSFMALIKKKGDKTETVVSFLAMLELVKRREIIVDQPSRFGDLNIIKNNDNQYE